MIVAEVELDEPSKSDWVYNAVLAGAEEEQADLVCS